MRNYFYGRWKVEERLLIGHMKGDHRMDRNHLAGWEGDRMNAILAGCGFNLMKLYRAAALYSRILLAMLGVGLPKSQRKALPGDAGA